MIFLKIYILIAIIITLYVFFNGVIEINNEQHRFNITSLFCSCIVGITWILIVFEFIKEKLNGRK